PHGEALRKCILRGPYKPITVLVQAVEATDDSLAVPKHTTVETPMNMSPKNKAHFLAEKEAIHLILTGIGDEIYSTVDACQTAQEMWEAIERLQQEWSRFVTIVKQQHKLDEVSYYKLFDILKQYQNKDNELRAERLARNANLLALIAKPITPPSEIASKEDIDPEQAQRDKDMQKNLAFIAKYFKKIYKPTNNNLRTSSNSKNKNVDTTPRFKNDNQSRQFRNQRMVNVAVARENVGSKIVQQSGIQCFNCREFRHFAKECRKPKRVKDSAYHKEKMLLCKFRHRFRASEIVETDDSNVIHVSPDMYEDDIQNEQNDVESDDEHVTLANLIANLKLDVDENKKIQKQLKKENTTLAQELKECKAILAETSKSLGEFISAQDSFLVALQTKQAEFEKYKAFNDRTIDYKKLELVKQKHDELMKQSLLTKSHYEGLVKQKTKQEMHADLKYVKSLEKEIDELESDKAKFSDMYDVILQECVSNDVKCSYLQSLSDLDALDELQCLYLLRSHRSSAPSPKPSIPSRSHSTTRHKGKEIAKPITPPSRLASKEDIDPEQAQRDKDMQKKLALIAKCFKKIYKPTNNNLRTSSNSKNKNVDTTPRYKNNDHSGQFGTQRIVNVAAARENVGSKVVKQSGIQCFNCREFGHFAKECRKPKRVKDFAYHKEKMLLYEEVNEQELEAHYSYMAKIQEVPTADSGTYSKPVEQNEQNDVDSDDERVALANLIANLKLDVDENKKIQKQLKKANTTLAQELKECEAILAETSKSLGSLLVSETQSDILKFVHELKQEMHADLKYVETLKKEIDELEYEKAEFSDMYDVILQECVSKDVMCSYMMSLSDLDTLNEFQCNLKLLCNFIEKFLGTVCFGNDQFVPILGYGDLVQGNVTINRVYYVEGLNHNLFSVESTSSTLLCLMAKATPTQAWLWHQMLSHLNFDYINLLLKKDIMIGLPKLKYVKDQLCSSCELSKEKRSSFKSKAVPSSKGRLKFASHWLMWSNAGC
nr:hypothetical protein [Tanacetum cinerariifolium]